MIIVTGPTGNTGSLVVEGLKHRGIPFRAIVRSEDKQRALKSQGVSAVVADFERPDTMRAALDGATAAYLVCTADERLARCERSFIAAARAAGVRHIVKCGAYGTSRASGSPSLRMHTEVEDALKDSGMAYTILRPTGFMQTFFWMTAQLVLERGVYSLPAGDGPMPLIDVRDVGEAALIALTTPGFEGREYNLTGPEALTCEQSAAILSRAFGRAIVYVESREEDVEAAMRGLGVPDAPRRHVMWCFREQRAGAFKSTTRDHESLGIRLRSYAEFAADLAAGKTRVATSDFSS